MSLWRQLIDYARQVMSLTEKTEQNAAQIRELQHEVRDLAAALQRLAYEVHRMQENEAHEREKMQLRLENALLRFERRLTAGTVKAPDDEENSE